MILALRRPVAGDGGLGTSRGIPPRFATVPQSLSARRPAHDLLQPSNARRWPASRLHDLRRSPARHPAPGLLPNRPAAPHRAESASCSAIRFGAVSPAKRFVPLQAFRKPPGPHLQAGSVRVRSLHLDQRDFKQRGQLVYARQIVPHPQRAMVRGTLHAPAVDEFGRPE